MGFTEKRFNIERFNRLPEEALTGMVEASFKHWRGLGQCEEKSAAEWREYLRNEDREAPRLHFAVTSSSRVVAMASVVEKNYPPSNEAYTPWLANFFVLPEFRGKGLIGMLRGQLISSLKQLGYSEVYVMAEADSSELHAKAGFVMIEPEQQIMRKILRS